MTPQPMIVVRDVQASSRWYQAVLGLRSRHGGPEYEQLMAGDRLVLQLHHPDVHEHPHLGSPEAGPCGLGVVLWFHEPAIVTAHLRAPQAGAQVLEPLKLNPLANHREFWLRDPDGYVVVVAGAYGDTGE